MNFATIPRYVERLFTGEGPLIGTHPPLPERADRVVVVLLDAFGRVFLERFGEHPLLRDIAVCPLDSQFPSTTAAHVTTMHTGLPVGRHGIYEWNVYEPSLDRVITPLRFSFAGDREEDTLRAAGVDPRDLVPPGLCLYERLAAHGVVSLVYQPDAFSPSTFDGAVVRAAEVRPFRDLADGLTSALRSVAALERGYAYVYFHGVDLVGHLSGPSSDDFAAAVRYALDAVEAALVRARAEGVLVLLTADHGQIDVDPAAALWLDDLHPPLRDMRLRPAGSGRDVFLHVDDVESTVAALSPHVETHAVADLLAEDAFGDDVGPRLLERLGDVCVLPPPGRIAWLRTAADPAANFRGHHGGRTPEETQTYLAALRLP
ncbi:MAG: alkaline phosphatase family protein [Solirubrobacteraceae bacterium]